MTALILFAPLLYLKESTPSPDIIFKDLSSKLLLSWLAQPRPMRY